MNGVVFAAAKNRPDRHDATGAFIPGAKLFARKYGLQVTLLDETEGAHKSVAHDTFMTTIQSARHLDACAK